jgi:DNA-binding LacI/PurR family transcriptional regulator
LRTAQTKVLALHGFVTAGRTESALTGVFILAVAEAARQRGFDLLLLPTHEGAAGIERLAHTSKADAVVVMGILMRDPRVDALRRLGFPAALLGHPEDDPGISWVDFDFVSAGRLAVELLVERGHRTFAFLGPPASVYQEGAGYAVRALRGARDAAATGNIRMLAPVRIEDVRDFRADLERLFATTPAPTAIVLQYEEALPELLRWLRGQRRRAPKDVHVVVVGPWSRDPTEPQVTYISSTIGQIASAVVDLAIDAATSGATRSLLLPPGVRVSRQ